MLKWSVRCQFLESTHFGHWWRRRKAKVKAKRGPKVSRRQQWQTRVEIFCQRGSDQAAGQQVAGAARLSLPGGESTFLSNSFLLLQLVRLEGSLKETNSPSLPVLPTSTRKTWDVPKKDPYYAVLMDPFKRSHSVEPKSEGYEPSFGSALRGKESSGHHRETYLKDLDEQVCRRID